MARYARFLAFMALAFPILAKPASITEVCGVVDSPEFIAASFEMAEKERNSPNGLLGDVDPNARYSIDTYVHIVAQSTREEDGYVTDRAVHDQMAAMNRHFAPLTSFQFVLRGITRTVNRDWANWVDEPIMQEALRTGDYKTLNFYSMFKIGTWGGICSYPWIGAKPGNAGWIKDGCLVRFDTLPGSVNDPWFHDGNTGSHEIGHWLGVRHTFHQDDCYSDGDYVDDTPVQAGWTQGCPDSRDSCPNHPGLDPIHNYMDYSDPVCKYEFTRGQNARMVNQFTTIRQVVSP